MCVMKVFKARGWVGEGVGDIVKPGPVYAAERL